MHLLFASHALPRRLNIAQVDHRGYSIAAAAGALATFRASPPALLLALSYLTLIPQEAQNGPPTSDRPGAYVSLCPCVLLRPAISFGSQPITRLNYQQHYAKLFLSTHARQVPVHLRNQGAGGGGGGYGMQQGEK